MPLTRVTITGADDNTDIDRMVRLTEKYPFVEWGVLYGSGFGARFPSIGWIEDLCELRGRLKTRLYLSLHLCGDRLRELCAGRSPMGPLGWTCFAFERLQLNFHGERLPDYSERIFNGICNAYTATGADEPEIICQDDGLNASQVDACRRRFRVSYLFDVSHGAGVLPASWPVARQGESCGWAGGLGPDNLREQLPLIDAVAPRSLDYWVDMETRVRTDEQLDLSKVEVCLQIAAEFMKG